MKEWFEKVRYDLINDCYLQSKEYLGNTDYMTPHEYAKHKVLIYRICNRITGCTRTSFYKATGINIAYNHTGVRPITTEDNMVIKEVVQYLKHLEFKTYIINKLLN